jgi:glutaredoxin
MSYYHLFVKSRCPHCKEAKDLLKSEKIEHVVTSMDKAPSILDKTKSSKHMDTHSADYF